jgi:hypothetical protein
VNLRFYAFVITAWSMCMAHVNNVHGENLGVTSRWIDQLSSSTATEADQAAVKVFQDGKYSLAGLMDLLDDERPFAGQLLFWDRASEMREAPTIGYVAMYLIHAIWRQRLLETTVPRLVRVDNSQHGSIDASAHLTPVPKWVISRSSSLKLPDSDLKIAKAAYRAWWTKRKPGEIENNNPLDGTGLEWR